MSPERSTSPSPGLHGTFENPILRGFHPDPSICRVGEDYYLVTSSFEYLPGIPIFTSTDLVRWVPIGHVLDREGQMDLLDAATSGGIYAPTIRHHDGVFYVTATNVSGRGHFIVHTTDPADAWSDPVWVDQDGIDPSLFFEGGKAYFTSNIQPDPGGPHLASPDFVRGIQQSVVDPVTGAILDGPRRIWDGTGARFPEAPHLYRCGEHVYLVVAEGGTEWGHISSVGRARSPWGPFEPSPHGPLLDHRSVASEFSAVGHADLVTLPDGRWVAVCLGIRPVGRGWPVHVTGRETLLTNVEWTVDGWPVAGDGGRVRRFEDRPLPTAATATPLRGGVTDFSETELGPEWVAVRRPPRSFTERASPDGGLAIRAFNTPLASTRPALIARPQEDHRFEAACSIDTSSLAVGGEAGMVVWMSERHHIVLALRRSAADRVDVVQHRRIGSLRLDEPLGGLTLGPTDLHLSGSRDDYRFAVPEADVAAPPIDVIGLSTEAAGGFTGAFVGVYADADADVEAVAVVRSFTYAPASAPDHRAQ